MDYLYILFGLLGLVAECSNKINTTNLVKKVGLGLIIIGCVLNFGNKTNNFIIWGAFMYISVEILRML